MSARPSRFARWLLERVLPADLRTHVPEDYDELFQRRAETHGRLRASAWYWRQLFAFIYHLAAERLPRRPLALNAGVSWIDIKLAARMLVRHPGLTLVAVLGMAVGIAIATATFTIASRLLNPVLPLDEGQRIVAIQNWNVSTQNRELRSRYDYETWRSELTSL